MKWSSFYFAPMAKWPKEERDGRCGFGWKMEGSEVDPFRPVTRWLVDASGISRLWIDPMVEEALGYKHKRRTLQEIVQSSRKEAAELIGFDEEPISVRNANSSSKALRQEAKKTPPKSTQDQEAPPSLLSHDPEKMPSKLSIGKKNAASPNAKMRLYEICAANRWERPSFVLCKEEGPSHRKMFTFKVIVKIEGISSTDLECYGEPKQQKKAAQEDAAEGALWYLKHLGYVPEA